MSAAFALHFAAAGDQRNESEQLWLSFVNDCFNPYNF